MKFYLPFIMLFLSLSAVSAQDVSSDADLENRIQTYKNNSASVIYDEKLIELKKEQLVGDTLKTLEYQIMTGEGKRVKLSFIAQEMGNTQLAKDLRWGESKAGFTGGLIASIISTALLSGTGIIGIVASYDNPFQLESTVSYAGRMGLLPFSITVLSISALTLPGIIIFSIFLAKASPFDFNIYQAKALVNQYNKFLKKKYNIPEGLNLSLAIDQEHLGLALSFQF